MSQGGLRDRFVGLALLPGLVRLDVVNEDEEVVGLALVVNLGLRSAALHFECEKEVIGWCFRYEVMGL